MRVDSGIQCLDFPCIDTNRAAYSNPEIDIDPQGISVVLISEAAPANPADGYYAGGSSLFQQTTLQAFSDAGVQADSLQDLVGRGIYFTTAVKCGKTTYNIETAMIQECSKILEREISLFPNVRAFLLMGDVAIKAINEVARRRGEGRVIPAGSTYKIRGGIYTFRGARVFPSYLQAGPSFNIEKSKRKMIAQDIAAAMDLLLQ